MGIGIKPRFDEEQNHFAQEIKKYVPKTGKSISLPLGEIRALSSLVTEAVQNRRVFTEPELKKHIEEIKFAAKRTITPEPTTGLAALMQKIRVLVLKVFSPEKYQTLSVLLAQLNSLLEQDLEKQEASTEKPSVELVSELTKEEFPLEEEADPFLKTIVTAVVDVAETTFNVVEDLSDVIGDLGIWSIGAGIFGAVCTCYEQVQQSLEEHLINYAEEELQLEKAIVAEPVEETIVSASQEKEVDLSEKNRDTAAFFNAIEGYFGKKDKGTEGLVNLISSIIDQAGDHFSGWKQVQGEGSFEMHFDEGVKVGLTKGKIGPVLDAIQTRASALIYEDGNFLFVPKKLSFHFSTENNGDKVFTLDPKNTLALTANVWVKGAQEKTLLSIRLKEGQEDSVFVKLVGGTERELKLQDLLSCFKKEE